MANDFLSGRRFLSRATVREVVVVVMSILIAFSLDAGWDGFRARAETRARLSAVLDEVRAAGPVLATAVRSHEARAAELAELRARLQAGSTGAQVAVPDSLIGPLLLPMVFEIPTRVTEAFLETEGAAELGDLILEAALGGWPTSVEDVRDDQLENRDYLTDVMNPFFRAHFDVAEAQEHAIDWAAVSSGAPGVTAPSSVLVSLAPSQELQNILSWQGLIQRALLRDLRGLATQQQELANRLDSVIGGD